MENIMTSMFNIEIIKNFFMWGTIISISIFAFLLIMRDKVAKAVGYVYGIKDFEKAKEIRANGFIRFEICIIVLYILPYIILSIIS